MPAPCTCDCGFTTDAGVMCLDWEAVGMDRLCAKVDGISGSFQNSPNWALQADSWLQWTNQTCRTHRVIAALDIPRVTIKIGGGNAWDVRGYIDGAINAAGPPVDVTREPEMEWSTNWYTSMPAGTDQEQRTPGSAEREWVVAPGDSVIVGYRFFARTRNYTAQTVNFLEIADYNISLSAWPSKDQAGSGSTC